MVALTNQPIDLATLVAQAQSPAAGAVACFLGITREFTADRQTAELYYQAYEKMAERELKRLEQSARAKWPLVECLVVHRLGLVPLAEASVAIVVSSPHRDAAFTACRWLIDTLKESAPIWKREVYVDGTTEWVHPTATPAPANPEAPRS